MSIPPIAALVPMKGHSERVPGKNIRPLCGRPLFHWILETLEASAFIREVFIDTDSDQIASLVQERFDVRIIHRPERLLGDHFVANDLIAHDLTCIPGYEFFLQTHSTNPLLRSETIDQAVEAFFSQDEHDTLFSITPLQARFYWPDGRPVNHEPGHLIPTQELPEIFFENSCMYLFSREAFLKGSNRLGERPMMFPMDPFEAVDIDEELDFTLAEVLMRDRLEKGSRS